MCLAATDFAENPVPCVSKGTDRKPLYNVVAHSGIPSSCGQGTPRRLFPNGNRRHTLSLARRSGNRQPDENRSLCDFSQCLKNRSSIIQVPCFFKTGNCGRTKIPDSFTGSKPSLTGADIPVNTAQDVVYIRKIMWQFLPIFLISAILQGRSLLTGGLPLQLSR